LPRLWPTKLRRYDDEAAKLAAMTPSAAPPARLSSASPSRFADLRSQQELAVKQWHAHYLRWAQPLKEAYTPVQQGMSSGKWSRSYEASCRQLAVETGKVMNDPTLFAAPDTRIGYPLRQAILFLNKLGDACGRSDLVTAQVYYARANTYLEQTAAILGEHKLPL
jgi:hypothetical protein